MRLHEKLLLGFALVALLMGCVGYVAQTMNARVEYGVVRLSGSAVPETEHATAMARALDASRDAVRTVAQQSSADSTARVALQEALAAFEVHLVEARAATLRGRDHAEQEGRSGDVAEADERMMYLARLHWGFETLRQVTLDSEATGPPARRAVVADSVAVTAIAPALAAYREAATQTVSRETDSVRTRLAQADRMLFGAVLLAIGLTLVLGIVIAHTIARPLLTLTRAAETVGQGDLAVRLPVLSGDEVGDLTAAFNAMTEELGRTTVSRRYLATIIHSMADPLFVTAKDGTIEMANEAAAAMTGLPLEALEGRLLAKLIAAGDPEVLLCNVEREGYAIGYDAAVRSADGPAVPVALSAAAMHEGPVQGVVWVAKDVTRQKREEDELRRARDEAEEAARLKTNFLANMSHEIRTPLTGIIGSAQVLRSERQEETREVGEIIERSAIRLLGTINSVLDMARLEAGGLQPHPEPVRLADEVADALGVLQVLADGEGLTLRFEEHTPDVWAPVDPSCFHRIVHNLVGNAIKFTREGSVVVELDAAGDEAILRVRDTGIGIAPRFLPHLFEEFQQESTGLTRSHEGTGLGLAITSHLVELMDGSIHVESTKGVGSVFTVRLPRLVRQSEPARSPRAAVASA